MRRHAAAVLVALAVSTSVLGLMAAPVRAECMYLPPWPPITDAIPTAERIVVGEVVPATEADLRLGPDQGPREHALRVTHVLRGGSRPGDLLDIQYLLPNWPQTRYKGGDGTSAPSCTYLHAEPGDVIALAFDALQPGGPMTENGVSWIQPPTRYNAVGVLFGPAGELSGPENPSRSHDSSTWQRSPRRRRGASPKQPSRNEPPAPSRIHRAGNCSSRVGEGAVARADKGGLTGRGRQAVDGGWRREPSGGASVRAQRRSERRPGVARRQDPPITTLAPPRDPDVVDLDFDQAVRPAIDRREVDPDRLARPRIERRGDRTARRRRRRRHSPSVVMTGVRWPLDVLDARHQPVGRRRVRAVGEHVPEEQPLAGRARRHRMGDVRTEVRPSRSFELTEAPAAAARDPAPATRTGRRRAASRRCRTCPPGWRR